MRVETSSSSHPAEIPPIEPAGPGLLTPDEVRVYLREAPIRTIRDASDLRARIDSLKNGECLVLLVTQAGDERNATYDPIFASYAVSDNRPHLYARSTDSAIAENYGVTMFPSVLIFTPGRPPHLVKDRLAVAKEAGYFTLPLREQLRHVEARFRDPDPSKRGSAVMAYGLTAGETADDALLTRATRSLVSMFDDPDPAVRVAALSACSCLRDKLPAKALLVLLDAVPVLFFNVSEIAYEALAMCRKIAGSPRFTADSRELKRLKGVLRAFSRHPDADLASGGVLTLAAFLPFLSDRDIMEVVTEWEELSASEHDFLRWSALYARGEALPRLGGDARDSVADTVLASLGDPYSGIRHRAILIVEANPGVFVPDRVGELSPALRALFSDPTQQLDVCDAAIRLYGRIGPALPPTERSAGIRVLESLRTDPEEHEKIRATAAGVLEELASQ